VYRVRITPDQPDFRLIVMGPDWYRPDAATGLKGGNEVLNVLVWRIDGFNDEIELTVEGLPKGVTCAPQVMGSGMRFSQLVLSTAADAPDWTGEIKVKGTATIAGKPVTREARPGSILWPVQVGQNTPRAARLDRSIAMAVRGQAPWKLTATVDKPNVDQGTTAVVTVKLDRYWADFKTPLQVQLFSSQGGSAATTPQGLTVAQATINAGQNEAKINVQVGNNTQPGTYNLVLRSTTQFPFNKDPKATNKQNTPVLMPSTPVRLTIVPKTLANLSLGSGQLNVKAGTKGEVLVRVARQFNYDGEFKVKLILPPGTQGVSAADVVIPPGQSEVKMVLDVAANAAPGARQNLTVQATAMFAGKTPVVHETKFNVNVSK
jgi:hypothetical protein